MASHSFGHQRSWGTFSYTVFWCILFDWATLSVPVYWVDTSFSCQEHSFSDKALKQTSFDAKSHWGMDLRIYNGFTVPCFTRVREICHVGKIWKRRHSGTWHWELRAEQRDSKFEGVHLPFPHLWFLNIFKNVVVWFSWPISWKPKFALLARSVCILGVVIAMIWHSTRDQILFPSILDLDTGGTKPSVQLEPLPVYCFLTLSCVSAWLLRSPQ